MAPLRLIPDDDTVQNDNDDDDDAGNEWMRIVVGRNRIEPGRTVMEAWRRSSRRHTTYDISTFKEDDKANKKTTNFVLLVNILRKLFP